MKTYKGFNADMTCRGFQYDPGGEYEMDGEIKACERGFHGCEMPLDVLRYYAPGKGARYFAVEQDGEIAKDGDDSKIASSKIKIGAEIGLPGLIKAQVEWVKARVTTEHTDPKQATAGDSGAATSRGSASVGKNGIACARGNGVRVRGGIGALLVIGVERDDSYDLEEWRAVVVDGETIKADAWYTLRDGELVEAE